MGILVKAPKCRNGGLKNHSSTITGKPVEWKEGIAELSYEQWEAVKGIKGYGLVEPDKPESVVVPEIPEETKAEIIPEILEAIHLEDDIPEVLEVPEPTGPIMIGEMVTMENTSREIREYADRQNPPVDIGKSRTKIEMLREISKHFELK